MNLVASRGVSLPDEFSDTLVARPVAQSDQQAKLFFIDVLAAIHRRWRAAAIVAAATVVLAIIGAFLVTPLYKSTATIMLDTRHENVVDLQAVLSNLPADTFVVDSEVELLRSPALSKRVIAKLNLDRDPEFNATLRPATIFSEISDGVKAAIHNTLVFFGLVPVSGLDAEQRQQEAVVEAFQQNLDVERTGLTYVITVSFWSQDAEKAVRIANALADAYVDQQKELKLQATRQANALLQKRIDSLRERVRTAEKAVADYKAKHGLLNAVGAPLTEQEISALNAQLAVARSDEAQQEGRLAAALAQAHQGGNNAIGQASTSDTIRALRTQEAEILQQEADLRSRYGPLHPALIKIEQQRAAIQSAINSEISRVVAAQRAETQAAQQRSGSLQASVDRDRAILALNNGAGVELAELERDADAVRSLYQSFLTRFQQTSAQEGMQDADAAVVSRATIPLKPSFPSWLLVLAAAFVLASMAAAATIALLEMMDRGVRSPETAEQDFGLPVLATVPRIAHEDPAAYAVEKPLSNYAEAFRNLRTALFLSRDGRAPKVIALTSAVPGEGKTTTALSLGRQTAVSGARVVIVDADLRRRSLSMRIPRRVERGLLELVAGRASLDECLVKDELSGAMILPAANTGLIGKDIFFAHDLGRVFDMLRERFDIILIDTAPLLPLAESRVVASHADTVVLLARWHETSRAAIADAVRLIQSVDVPIAGLALSNVDLKQLGSFGYSARTYNYQAAYAGYYVN
jgi:capsular exopolysaccharide synthesis family protein